MSTVKVDPASEAVEALRRGIYSIPIESGGKRPPPELKGWQNLRITEADVPRLWSNGEGIGYLLGEPSGGMVDVDLDCPGAVRAADLLLPSTGMVHGCSGAPASHRWYVADPIPETVRFKDPEGNTLVELRSTGGQTNVPPTVHPSGEPLRWEWRDDRARVDGEVLRHAVQHLAAASLLARVWPTKGGHDTTLALAGALLRAGWGEEKTVEFVRAIGPAATW